MGWKKDVFAPMIGTVIGGLISLGSTWYTNYGASQKDYATERRQKLETLVMDLFTAEACTNKDLLGEAPGDACEASTSAYRSMAYAKIYFPELYKSVSQFQVEQAQFQLDFAKCMLEAGALGEVAKAERKVICAQEYVDNPATKKDQLEKIIDSVRQVELATTPKPLTLKRG
jgi:hypothetical protein